MATASTPMVHLVGGAPRSGTTLLQAVLSDSNDTAPLLGEARFLRHILDFYHEVDRSWDDDARYYFSSRSDALGIARDTAMSVFRALAARHNSSHVVVKSPELTLRPREIQVMLPDAHKYATLRDPRDIVALQWEASVREIQRGFEPSMFPKDLIQLATSGNRVQPTSRITGHLAKRLLDHYSIDVLDSWTIVCYESLIHNPRGLITNLADTSELQIRFNPDSTWRNVEFDFLRKSKTMEGAWSSVLWGKPLSSSRVGVFHHVLPDDQVRLVERICGHHIALWQELAENQGIRSK